MTSALMTKITEKNSTQLNNTLQNTQNVLVL